MTIRHLQIFKTVFDCGGITAAADRLNMTQPSVSIAIREMESFYGVRLFDRVNRGVYPTEAGTLLRRYAESVLEPFDEAIAVLRDGKSFSKCRLGVNVSVAEAYLEDFIKKIKAAVPEADINITVDNNEHLNKMLTENRIDFAVCDGMIDRASKIVVPLFEEEQVAVFAPSLCSEDEIGVERLSKYPLLLREQGSGQRSCVDAALAQFGSAVRIVATSASTLALIGLAENGSGVAVIPRKLAENLSRTHQLHIASIAAPGIRRAYFLAYLRGKNLLPAMKKAIEAISG